MEMNEILSVKSEETAFVIVDGDIYIGEPNDDSEKGDTVIGWENDILIVDGYPLTEAMVIILKMYLDKKL